MILSRACRFLSPLIFPLVGGLTACGPRHLSEAAFYQWINNPAHGLVKVARVNQVRLTVKYLPPGYLAYQEWKRLPGAGQPQLDSLRRDYQRSHAFLLTLQTDVETTPGGKSRPAADILYRGISSYQDYQQRIQQLNFGMADCVALETGAEVFRPVLHNLENTYGAVTQRSLYFVFAEDSQQRGLFKNLPLDFTFRDPFFETGTHHFIFDPQQIQRIPTITPAHD